MRYSLCGSSAYTSDALDVLPTYFKYNNILLNKKKVKFFEH